jgi:hypothetical protein
MQTAEGIVLAFKRGTIKPLCFFHGVASQTRVTGSRGPRLIPRRGEMG